MQKKVSVIVLFLIGFLFPIQLLSQSLPDNIDISTSPIGVVSLPSSVPSAYANGGFVKYTKIACSNGEAIHFIAQNAISDAQIVRARTILEFYLKNVPGSQFGADKTNVANTMGTNDATLLLLNGSDDGSNDPNVPGQPLYQEEMAVEGHTWYQNNNYDHRDASFEEILHLMHDMGIGVDGSNSIPNPALPAYQTEIRNAQLNANGNNFDIWPIGAGSDPGIQGWYNELSNENSLSQEYLASVIDSYYGLWDPWIEDPTTGMWGIYKAHNRDEIQTEDPMGLTVVSMFFSPIINVDMIIDPSFNGIFSLTFTNSTSYTAKSRYLQHVYLTGSNASGLQGNEEYNRLTGNSANNTFEGLKGNDRLDGQGGENTAIFTGSMSEYTIDNQTDYAIVTDGVANRDGIDTLWNMHFLQFSDQTIPITLTNTASVEQLNTIEPLLIYPNPSENIIYCDQSVEHSTYAILSLSGEVVQSGNYSSNGIFIGALSSGMYFLEYAGQRNRFTKK